jgi:hypothetical protein
VLSLPVLASVALAAFAVVALLELTPESAALRAGARGRWLLSEDLPWLGTAGAGAALAALSALPSWRRHRPRGGRAAGVAPPSPPRGDR